MAVVEVVKYHGAPDVFAWKYPNDELGTWTQLIVNESQEAVLFKGGQALDVFGSGRHTLETANIPLLNHIIKLPFGGRSPFQAEVWFISKVHSLDVKWGTATPIQLQDPKYGVFVSVRSFGQFGIKIFDSKRFLIKLVGTLSVFDKSNVVKYFRGLYLTKVKDAISSYLVHKKISILEINAYLEELSTFLEEKIRPTLDEYGIELVNFYINDINIPEDELGIQNLKEALSKRAEMDIIGYNYQQQRSFDTLEGAAKNPGSGSANLMGAGVGLSLGASLGGAVGKQFGGLAGEINVDAAEQRECPQCHAVMDKHKRFCADCGFDTQQSRDENRGNAIKCRVCGAALISRAKFCPECGNQYNPCPACGADLAPDTVKCHICGYEKPPLCPHCGQPLEKKTQKFCSECGASLIKKCGKCNAEINGNPKFCPECGEKL